MDYETLLIARQKNPSVKTVVNKLETINNQFRVFDMELLAGEPRYVVEHVCVKLPVENPPSR